MARVAPDLTESWVLDPQVAVRPEPFGALLYHFGTRRLSFLKDRTLTAVVAGLDGKSSLAACCERAGLDPGGAAGEALAVLAATGMIRKVEP